MFAPHVSRFQDIIPAPARHHGRARSAALEREIPHIVTQAFAALLESSGTALSGPGNEPFIGGDVAQSRACVEYLQHSIRNRVANRRQIAVSRRSATGQ